MHNTHVPKAPTAKSSSVYSSGAVLLLAFIQSACNATRHHVKQTALTKKKKCFFVSLVYDYRRNGSLHGPSDHLRLLTFFCKSSDLAIAIWQTSPFVKIHAIFHMSLEYCSVSRPCRKFTSSDAKITASKKMVYFPSHIVCRRTPSIFEFLLKFSSVKLSSDAVATDGVRVYTLHCESVQGKYFYSPTL